VLVGHVALRKLARLKLRAWLRSSRRRLSTWSGIVFALLGLLVMTLWIGSVAFRYVFTRSAGLSPELQYELVRVGLFVLTSLTVTASLAHRGLYLPKDEIERLLSAPVARADLVRYRLLSNLMRTFVFAIIMAFVVAARMPVPGFAFVGMVLAVMTLPMAGQAAALLFGDAENRLGRFLKRAPIGLLRIVTGVLTWAFFMVILFTDEVFGPDANLTGFDLTRVIAHPVVQALALPFTPWAKMISAESVFEFMPWLLACLAIWFTVFEATARIPVDFRELSLQTSADVARKLSRMRSGRNLISGGSVSKRALGWNVPWLFGRGPFGAIAWLKLCSIVRKSRGTLMFSIVVIGFITFLTTTYIADPLRDPLTGSLIVAGIGTIYLCAGLRFDFRSDLDLMETVKAWPLAAWRIFLATILPEVVLVSALIAAAVLLRSAILGQLPLVVWFVIPCVPVIALMWTALDNAVFLFAPVRFVPGQGGAMHHTGRALVLVFIRTALLLVVVGALFGIRFGTNWIGVYLELPEAAKITFIVATCGAFLAAAAAALIGLGGWALARYDVARERTMMQ